MWVSDWFRVSSHRFMDYRTMKPRTETYPEDEHGGAVACYTGMAHFSGIRPGNEIRFCYAKTKPRGDKETWFEIMESLRGADSLWRWGGEGEFVPFCEAAFWDDDGMRGLRGWLGSGKRAFGWIEIRKGGSK